MSRLCPSSIPLHLLLIAHLDIVQEWYLTRDLGVLLGISTSAIARHIRRRYPSEKGETRRVHRLDFREAVLLIRAVCREGRRLPDRDLLYSRLVQSGFTDAHLHCAPAVRLAESIFEAERQRITRRIGQ
jgi:hypothetical protein